MKKVSVASLGCSKNLVDSENFITGLLSDGFVIEPDEREAEIIVVNTCCFIDEAKQESFETIAELAEYKKSGKCRLLVVTGCMADRYGEELVRRIPEIDAVAKIGADLTEVFKKLQQGNSQDGILFDGSDILYYHNRVRTTPGHFAYLKIAEGCDNNCTYCIIPYIRGRYISRTPEDILTEAQTMVQGSVREIIVIAQDTASYGCDLAKSGTDGCTFAELLERLSSLNVRWIRLHYLYPEKIDDELISIIASKNNICRYLDIPIQHCSDAVLKRMGRRVTKAYLTRLFARLRAAMPDVVIRTTVIVGFPGETDEQFEELCSFIKEQKFERLGVFMYSKEENTPASRMDGQISREVMEQRYNKIIDLQYDAAGEAMSRFKGRRVSVVTEGYDEQSSLYFGRCYADSPDIDGNVFFSSSKTLSPGDFADVLVTGSEAYDLYGELAEGES